jgi:hypothetical protein
MLQAGRSRIRFPMRSLDFSIDLILQLHYGTGVDSVSNIMSASNLLGGKGRPEHKSDNPSAICESIV